MKYPYGDLDLIRLSAQDGAVHLDRQLILLDNFDESSRRDDAETFFTNHPVKISFTTVIICLTGCIRFRINLQDFHILSNDILVVQEGTIGEYTGMDEHTKIAVIAFTPEYFQPVNQIEETMSLHRRFYTSPLCHMDPEAIEECMTIYRLMKMKMAQTDNPFRKGSLLGYTQVLTYNAYSYLLDADAETVNAKEKAGRKQDLYNRFMKEVQKNYIRQRSISYYADLLCVTPKYLSQIVHQVSGRFAGDWITDFVVLEAKALLKSHKYTIQQIADMLNFANQSFFGKYFKEKTGYSPSEYQKHK